MQNYKLNISRLALIAVAILCSSSTAGAKDEQVTGQLSDAKTLDIVNTLKSKGNFHTLLDGLGNAYSLDNKLKGKGPFTLFAPDDRAWGKLSDDDRKSLFGNNMKLKQVLTYHIVDGKLNSKALGMMRSVKTVEGHSITLSTKKENGKEELYADKARVTEADIKCVNGVIHVINQPIMPPLQK